MFVSKITVSRLKNLGNYENERFDCEVTLNKGDDVEKAYSIAKGFVIHQIRRHEHNINPIGNIPADDIPI